jgi:hypothetical protein
MCVVASKQARKKTVAMAIKTQTKKQRQQKQ